jgi:TolA-binding protein
MKSLKINALLVMFVMVLISSCTSYASKEEVTQLDETKAKAKSMENKVVELTNEKKKADQDLQQKKQKLEQAKKEKDEVLKRLEAMEKAK